MNDKELYFLECRHKGRIVKKIKEEVAARNQTFNIADVEILLHNAFDNVPQEVWAKCVRHAEELQDKNLRKIILRDQPPPLIINLQEDDTDGEDTDEDFW
ncbi:unnamed protein product [Pieris macdunnoughi]|uniref:Uncharacterized protein n=1 Tax=Pieris macdunnoughi TaxID=345717 RepID=A0A821XI88_9NEOP|nr:unnamed protein product [Pieris macdunnoughi]